MALGDIVKSIFVKIKVGGAEEAKSQMAEIAALADKLNHSDPTIKVDVDKNSSLALKGLTDQLKSLRDPKVSQDLRDLAARFHMLAATTNDARVRTKALRGELDALGKDMPRLSRLLSSLSSPSNWITGFGSSGGWQQLLTSPAVWVAALASLPFLAQAAAGGIVLALGGAMTALGVYAESGTRSVKYQFAQLVSGKDGISATLKNISPAFGEALTTILSAARTFLPQFIRDFGPALDAIAGPLKSIGVEFLGLLANPQVATAITEVGKAFGSILKALGPQLPGIFTAFADAITNLAKAIEKNPKAIADFINGMIRLIPILIEVMAWLTQVADFIELHFIPAFNRFTHFVASWAHDIAHNFDSLRHEIAHIWDLLWNNTIGRAERGLHDIAHDFDQLRHHTANVFDGIRHDIAHYWDMAWNNTIGRIIRGVHDVETWFDNLKAGILRKVSNYSTLLVQAGKDLLNGLKTGINDMFPGLLKYVEQVGSSILAHIKSALGIGSPSRITYQHGLWVAQGLAMGMDAGTTLTTAAAMRLGRSAIPSGGAYGGGGVLRLEVTGGGGGALDRLFIAWLKNYVRVAGGGGPQSVQRALGQVWR